MIDMRPDWKEPGKMGEGGGYYNFHRMKYNISLCMYNDIKIYKLISLKNPRMFKFFAKAFALLVICFFKPWDKFKNTCM